MKSGRKKSTKATPQSLDGAADDASKSARAEVLRHFPEHDARLVAEIAARLLVGDGCDDAAERALRLLDATAAKLRQRDELREKLLSQCEQADVPADSDFKHGIKYITGQTRRDRADDDWVDFLPDFIREGKICNAENALPPGQLAEKSIPATTPAEVAKVQKRHEQKGFSGRELSVYRQIFRRWKKKH